MTASPVTPPAGDGRESHVGGREDAVPAPIEFVDSHCHVEMLGGAEAPLAAARTTGVVTIVAVGIDVESSRQAAGFAAQLAHGGPVGGGSPEGDEVPGGDAGRAAQRRFPRVVATVGLHPHDAARCDDACLADLEALARRPGVVAVGECGLDFYRDLSPRDDQRHAFVAQIELARCLGLPLVVHTREAGDETMDLLARHAEGLTVVMHCFSLPAWVDECNARGYYASFAGNLTYRNAGDLRDAAARVREDLVLLETDAPFLSPVPYRGKPNSPARVVITAATLAEARGWTLQRAAAVTTANAERAMRLGAAGSGKTLA